MSDSAQNNRSSGLVINQAAPDPTPLKRALPVFGALSLGGGAIVGFVTGLLPLAAACALVLVWRARSRSLPAVLHIDRTGLDIRCFGRTPWWAVRSAKVHAWRGAHGDNAILVLETQHLERYTPDLDAPSPKPWRGVLFDKDGVIVIDVKLLSDTPASFAETLNNWRPEGVDFVETPPRRMAA